MDTTKKFITYKSSAGSGKTYTLVKEFLKIVLTAEETTRYRNILAITFTNKAANEMKERVIDNLKLLSEQTPTKEGKRLLDDYAKDFGIETNVIKNRAEKVLVSVLHNYSDLKISTIDKFTHKIIRAFSKDLNLPPDFEVELDTKNILTTAIDLLISKAGEDENISSILLDFMDKQIKDEKSWNLERNLIEFSGELIKEDNQKYLSQIKNISPDNFKIIKKEVQSKTSLLKKEIIGFAKKAKELIENKVDTSKIKSANLNHFTMISNQDFKKIMEPTASILKAINEDDWLLSKKEDAGMDEIKEEIKLLYFSIQNTAKEYFLMSLINENVLNLVIVNEINKAISTLKEENNILLISDFNQLISNEIKDQPAPFIYEKIGERYKNIMLDEFQDTSVLQWHNLLPLIDNSLSIGEKTLLVGDGKQAIYRFRGGKVEQFVSLPKIIDKPQDDFLLNEREIALHNNHFDDNLETNYRSHQQVIEFNNWFFEELKTHLPAEKQVIYDNQSQFFTDKKEGYVDVEFIEPEKDTSLDELYLEKTLEKINECLEDGFLQKDIALLVRGNKKGLLLSEYLIENGLNVITSESLLVKDDKEVNFVLNLLRFIQNKEDNKAKVEIIKYLYREEKFSKILLHNSFKKDKYSKTKIDVLSVIKQIVPEFSLVKLFQLSLYDLTETILRDFGLTKNVSNPFLLVFLEYISTFSLKTNDLMQFLEKWELKSEKLSIETPSNTDAITIMTIHKSKGLQFPVVISTFTNWSLSYDADNVWIDTNKIIPNLPVGIIKLKKEVELTDFSYLKEENDADILLDNFNLLYVVLTRAEKRLYVISDINENTKGGQLKGKIGKYLNIICRDNVKYDANTRQLLLGERTKEIPTETPVNEEESELFLERVISENWREKIEISQQYKKVWGEENYKEKIAYGNLIHDLLAQIDTEKDIEIAVNSFVENGLIELHEKDIFTQELIEIITIKEVKNWFNGKGKSMNEKEIISKEGYIFIPDKVVVFKDRTVVIDFKTGNRDKKHEAQITKYGTLLEEMNYPNVEKYLLYTREKEVVSI